MTKRPEDRDLAERFERLRSETEHAGNVPDFEAMMARARAEVDAAPSLSVVEGGADSSDAPRRRRVLWLGGAASAALAATVAGLLLTSGPTADEEFDRLVASYASDAASTWRSPTSGLLDVPGIELVRTVPSVGRGLPAVGTGDAGPPRGETRS